MFMNNIEGGYNKTDHLKVITPATETFQVGILLSWPSTSSLPRSNHEATSLHECVVSRWANKLESVFL